MLGYVFLYLDDIISAKTDDKAFQRLKVVFTTASKYGLEINAKKCSFLSKQIYLGNISSLFKTAAVINFPEPYSHKDLVFSWPCQIFSKKFILNFWYHCSVPF